MFRSTVLAVALGVACGAADIYPDGHFEMSTKLTTGNYKDVIQETIDSGKTLLVRFIASSG